MKRVVLLSFALFVGTVVFAQIKPHTIGLRFGGGNSINTEFSYQRGVSNKNRWELDLGLRSDRYYSGFGFSGLYQWVWDVDAGFSWYLGVGGQVGAWSWNSKYHGSDDDGVWMSALCQGGFQYQFSEIPVQVSLDTRPSIPILNYNHDLGYWDLALSIRYTFR